jgi:hypothetical protein
MANMINACNRILSVIHIILETIKIEWTTRGQFYKLNFYIDQLISHIIYITAHILNRVTEKVRELFPNVKKSFLKSPGEILVY